MNKNAILIIILVLIAAFGAWWFWPSGGGGVQISPTSVESGKALELVSRIKAIEIDTAFFDDPEFLSLESLSPLSLEGFTKGRPNPFLKLAGPSSAVPVTKPPLVRR